MLRLLGWRKSEQQRRDELLSAYLDGELSEREREQLETRLSEDPALRAELRALHQTMSLVRELPRASAPRNFILTESMVRGREPAHAPEPRLAWAAPILTAATAVVSLLFAVVLAGDLLLPGVGGFASAPEPMLQSEERAPMEVETVVTREVERESAVGPAPSATASSKDMWEEPEMAAEDELSPAEATRAAEAPAGMGGAPEAEDTTPAEEAPEEPEAAVEEELSPAEATRAAQAPPGAGATPPPPAEDAGPTEEVRSLAAPTTPPPVTERFVLTPTIPPEEPRVSEEELGLLVEPTLDEFEATPPPVWEREGLSEARVPWRALEVALGLAALVLTFGTIRAWQARRG
ncbi:MAG: zf-HC2 domain-containing protein [Chloroflexota bacterium]|nr:zf-HC2 domain-containing protein [Chloroflexota bacterium]